MLAQSHLHRFHAALGKWYGAHGRHDLPWRITADPYAIWVSEIMLQQTQVETVRSRFYTPFLTQFPSVQALAGAPREQVMKAWEGLGYYRRAGNLHEAAKQLVLEGGVPPPFAANAATSSLRSSPKATHALLERWLALPGIGRNTAHAILAFGFRQPYAVMEANVKRVISRLFALTHPPDNTLWEYAEALLNRAEPFDYNQAMMDMGAVVCTVKAPKCSTCPAAFLCEGKTSPEHYPAKKTAKKIPTRRVVILVQQSKGGKLLLERRDDALLGGLYGFPQTTPGASPGTLLGHITHVYSHFRLEAEVHLARTARASNRFYSLEEIAALPLSKLDHKVLALLATAT